MNSYSQCGQDLFVLNMLNKNDGTFLDLGCSLPKKINNTYLLETLGWQGVSIDIQNFSEQWKERKNKFIQSNCFEINYNEFLPEYYKEKTIDYLSLDMEVIGERYKLLQKVLDSGYEFKVITIEHDSHISQKFVENEKIPQRKILTEYGYILVCSDVSQKQHPESFYEDWWVNSKFFTETQIKPWISDRQSCDKIFDKLGIDYTVAQESLSW